MYCSVTDKLHTLDEYCEDTSLLIWKQFYLVLQIDICHGDFLWQMILSTPPALGDNHLFKWKEQQIIPGLCVWKEDTRIVHMIRRYLYCAWMKYLKIEWVRRKHQTWQKCLVGYCRLMEWVRVFYIEDTKKHGLIVIIKDTSKDYNVM